MTPFSNSWFDLFQKYWMEDRLGKSKPFVGLYDTFPSHCPNNRLLRGSLALESTNAKLGIRNIRAAKTNTVKGLVEDEYNAWEESELHVAMEEHWCKLTNKTQWEMWILAGTKSVWTDLTGILFDAYLSDGNKRQGVAVFSSNASFVSWFQPRKNPQHQRQSRENFLWHLCMKTDKLSTWISHLGSTSRRSDRLPLLFRNCKASYGGATLTKQVVPLQWEECHRRMVLQVVPCLVWRQRKLLLTPCNCQICADAWHRFGS